MALTFEQLKGMTVVQLREVAKGLSHEAVQGYTQLNKDHLLVAVCRALGLDSHVHHHVVGLDKAGIKARIRQLKKDRNEAIASHDPARLKAIRRQVHGLKRRIHKASV